VEDAGRVDRARVRLVLLERGRGGMPKFGRPMADRKDVDGRWSRIETEYFPWVLQPLYRLLSGPGFPADGFANPPKTVCQ